MREVNDFPGEYAARIFRSMLRSHHPLFVADADGVLAGATHADMDPDRRHAYVVAVIVDKRYRRQGIARALLGAVESLCRKRKFKGVFFLVRAWNKPMLAVARRLGYGLADRAILCRKRL